MNILDYESWGILLIWHILEETVNQKYSNAASFPNLLYKLYSSTNAPRLLTLLFAYFNYSSECMEALNWLQFAMHVLLFNHLMSKDQPSKQLYDQLFSFIKYHCPFSFRYLDFYLVICKLRICFTMCQFSGQRHIQVHVLSVYTVHLQYINTNATMHVLYVCSTLCILHMYIIYTYNYTFIPFPTVTYHFHSQYSLALNKKDLNYTDWWGK